MCPKRRDKRCSTQKTKNTAKLADQRSYLTNNQTTKHLQIQHQGRHEQIKTMPSRRRTTPGRLRRPIRKNEPRVSTDARRGARITAMAAPPVREHKMQAFRPGQISSNPKPSEHRAETRQSVIGQSSDRGKGSHARCRRRHRAPLDARAPEKDEVAWLSGMMRR